MTHHGLATRPTLVAARRRVRIAPDRASPPGAARSAGSRRRSRTTGTRARASRSPARHGRARRLRSPFDPDALSAQLELQPPAARRAQRASIARRARPDGTLLREYEIYAVDREIEIAPGVKFPAWTYNGQVPGPTIRATEGDRLRVRFLNQGSHPHTIHFHGWHPPAMDGSLPEHEVLPGESFVYEFDAEPAGLHLYHCHAVPLKRHIHKGLYGTFIVDPRGGRPPADELVMMMNGFDTNFDNENEVYAVNTVANAYMADPIKVTVGRLVRIYLVNITEFDLINSFHLHGMFFDAYRPGTRTRAERAHRHHHALPGRTRDPRDDVPLSGRLHVPRAPERVRGAGGWGCSGPRRRAVSPEASSARCCRAARRRIRAVSSVAARRSVPLVLLGALLALIVGVGPTRLMQGPAIAAGRAACDHAGRRSRPAGSTLTVLNDGPDEVTIAQVVVDDAFWTFEASPGPTLAHLGRAQLSIPYPWVHGETHVVQLLTSTGRDLRS